MKKFYVLFLPIWLGCVSQVPDAGNLKAYPNPYNPDTGYLTIEKTDGTAFVTGQYDLVIYDYNQKEVYRANPSLDATGKKIIWSGTDSGGTKVAPGLYYLHLIQVGTSGSEFSEKILKITIQ